MSRKAAAFLAIFIALGLWVYTRMQPTPATFHTACSIPVYSPDHEVDRQSMEDAIIDFLREVERDCRAIDMLRIKVRENGWACDSSPTLKCAGTISGTLIHLGWFPDMRHSALRHELHHWLRGDTGWQWSHPDGGRQ